MEQNRIKEILKKIESESKVKPLIPEVKPKVFMNEISPPPPRLHRASKWRIFALALLAFLCLILFIYGALLVWRHYRVITDENPSSIIAEIGRLAELPQDEAPVVETLTEVESLKDQVFFKDAKVGDKVVVFNVSKKAYLYRPSTKKIINIASLSE